MFAARASMPVNIRDGSVTNEPPPASAFCAPAHMAAKKSTIIASIRKPLPARAARRKPKRPSARTSGERARHFPVRRHQRLQIDANGLAVDDPPIPADHHPIRAMRAA